MSSKKILVIIDLSSSEARIINDIDIPYDIDGDIDMYELLKTLGHKESECSWGWVETINLTNNNE